MSESNGVIRVGRKGKKKFAFGDGDPFEVDVVVAFQEWGSIDGSFRNEDRVIPQSEMMGYHQAAVAFVQSLWFLASVAAPAVTTNITTAEALDFIARLREQYDEVSVFFQPKSRDKPDLHDTLGSEMRFSVEES
jgi:hypothetical protein